MSNITREILQLGNPKLRLIAQTVEDPKHPDIKQVIDDLITIMGKGNGVGIAAPQVGINLQIMIVASRPTLRYPHAPKIDPIAMINPQITQQGTKKIKDWEGCLSIPGIRGLVPRSQEITVTYLDHSGKPYQQVFNNFVARIIQHECDHLQGDIFIDRVETTRELITEDEYHKLLVA